MDCGIITNPNKTAKSLDARVTISNVRSYVNMITNKMLVITSGSTDYDMHKYRSAVFWLLTRP